MNIWFKNKYITVFDEQFALIAKTEQKTRKMINEITSFC